MPRLTEAARALVLEHLRAADLVADQIRTRQLDRDDRHGIALLALCRAAAAWPGRGDFFNYAVAAGRRAVIDVLRRKRPSRRTDGQIPVEWDWGELEARMDADTLRGRFDRLSDLERRVLDLYAAGHGAAEIARILGLSGHGHVRDIRRRATKKLL